MTGTKQDLLPELTEFLELAKLAPASLVRLESLATLSCKNLTAPFVCAEIGSRDTTKPVFLLVGGVHGLERIGTRVISAFMNSIIHYASWDIATQAVLEEIRIVIVPIVNPIGMILKRRSNGNSVDLMRNAPVEMKAKKSFSLVSGQRFSPKLPWYRGKIGSPMEQEALLLEYVVSEILKDTRFLLSLDVHSGFGLRDRLWYPFAYTQDQFFDLPTVTRLSRIFESTFPNHMYRIESQSASYTTHGDLWDFFYLKHLEKLTLEKRKFIPLTLELGSWNWIKKNPAQLLSFLGVFHPMMPHRVRRTLRRHLPLLDFLMRYTAALKF